MRGVELALQLLKAGLALGAGALQLLLGRLQLAALVLRRRQLKRKLVGLARLQSKLSLAAQLAG